MRQTVGAKERWGLMRQTVEVKETMERAEADSLSKEAMGFDEAARR